MLKIKTKKTTPETRGVKYKVVHYLTHQISQLRKYTGLTLHVQCQLQGHTYLNKPDV